MTSGRCAAPDGVDDYPVAAAQPLLREPEAAELVLLVRIRAGEIEDASGRRGKNCGQRPFELLQEGRIAGVVGQPDVVRPGELELEARVLGERAVAQAAR